MSLRDHYTEKGAEESGSFKGADSWAIKYLNIGRTTSILEAFDDDASGFITIREVNRFTGLKPQDWRYGFSSEMYKACSLTRIVAFPTG